MENKSFEMGKFYCHTGGGKMHIIAEAYDSEMYMIDKGNKMFIAEERDGSMYGFTSPNDMLPATVSHQPLKQKQKLNPYPTELGNIKPVGSSEESASNWFEITREIFLLEDRPERINISCAKRFDGVHRDVDDFYYRYVLCIFPLTTGNEFYLINCRNTSTSLLSTKVFTRIKDILSELKSKVDHHRLIKIEKELFKYAL